MATGRHFLKRAPCLLALVSFFSQAGQTVEVNIADYRFQPQEIRIKPGDTVRWVNREKRTSHSVIFPDGRTAESERLFPDEHWEHTFPQAGSFPYRCGPHPEMTGVVHVAD